MYVYSPYIHTYIWCIFQPLLYEHTYTQTHMALASTKQFEAQATLQVSPSITSANSPPCAPPPIPMCIYTNISHVHIHTYVYVLLSRYHKWQRSSSCGAMGAPAGQWYTSEKGLNCVRAPITRNFPGACSSVMTWGMPHMSANDEYIWICTARYWGIEFLDLGNFGQVAFSVESVIFCATFFLSRLASFFMSWNYDLFVQDPKTSTHLPPIKLRNL